MAKAEVVAPEKDDSYLIEEFSFAQSALVISFVVAAGLVVSIPPTKFGPDCETG